MHITALERLWAELDVMMGEKRTAIIKARFLQWSVDDAIYYDLQERRALVRKARHLVNNPPTAYSDMDMQQLYDIIAEQEAYIALVTSNETYKGRNGQ